ncbi:MAG TPA: Gfo/Idh/MocA family oxidoreductase [Acidimicrobiia bacterium]
MTDPLRLGVIGANSFVAKAAIYPAIQSSGEVEVVAAASNSGVPEFLRSTARPDYQAVIDDPSVEAVYIPLPNSMHREWTERAAASGKHVLCEKPLASAVEDVAAMYAACRRSGVVLAEAFMTPFHPRTAAVIDACRRGAVGEIRSIRSEFTFTIDAEHSENYRWQAVYGGGALWDVGIYTLSPIVELLGEPVVCQVTSHTGASDVDATTSVGLTTSDALATALCSFEMPERQLLEIRGTAGTLTVEQAFTPSVQDDAYLLARPDGSRDHIITGGADPYRRMIEAFARACRDGSHWPRTEDQTRGMVARIAEIHAMATPAMAPDPSMR